MMHNSRPLVCVGMGMAVLASFGITIRQYNIWHAFRAASKRSVSRAKSRQICSSKSNTSENDTLPTELEPVYVPCNHEHSTVSPSRLSGKKITIVQVDCAKDKAFITFSQSL